MVPFLMWFSPPAWHEFEERRQLGAKFWQYRYLGENDELYLYLLLLVLGFNNTMKYIHLFFFLLDLGFNKSNIKKPCKKTSLSHKKEYLVIPPIPHLMNSLCMILHARACEYSINSFAGWLG